MAWLSAFFGGLVNTDHLAVIKRGKDLHFHKVTLGVCEGVYVDGEVVTLYCGPDPKKYMSGLAVVLGNVALESEIQKRGKPDLTHTYGQMGGVTCDLPMKRNK